MHNHNDNDQSGFNRMMWLMMLCCALPVLAIFLFGSKISGGQTWLILGVMVVMVAGHLFICRKSKPRDEKPPQDNKGEYE